MRPKLYLKRGNFYIYGTDINSNKQEIAHI